MHTVKFSLFLPTGDFAKARAAAEWADTRGFYSVSINDHFFSPLGAPHTPQLECFSTLSAIAAVTKNVRLAPAMAAMSFRHPPMLAKMASTLDHISNGRLVLGVGSGWQRSEYDAHGYPYPSNVERLEQLGDAIKLIKAMWTQEEPTYRGRYFSVEKAYNYPRPVQKPHPPIMVGGAGKKLLQIAAAEAQIANLIPPIVNGKDFVQDPGAAVRFDKAELKRRIAMLRGFVADAGRDPGSVEISGVAMVNLSRSKSEAGAALKAVASAMGFPGEEAARNAPVLLVGTPEEVRRELRSRIEEFGMTYYVVFPRSEESRNLLVSEIMPDFTATGRAD
ncbi:MAG TPA: LLM class flavin-dependent oxidoreductase [Candidatus Binatia bacterium]|jgi:probable F420-dependent oxidoreductase|nr:LLM class flavin-dependent oxidoreductase [Candidatus Binatia bacterium]